jgi:hypothetical protein
MASMAELARQLLGMNGNSVGGVSPDRYMEVMDRSPYGTGVPLEIGYGEQDQMSPLDAAAIVTGGVPVVGDLTGLAADVDMYMRDPESRNIPNYLLTAAGVLPFLPAASQVRQGIKAYHGSPHDFPPVRELEMPDGAVVYQHMDDAVPEGASVIKEHPLGRFDMSKIGSGEGAQAYGRGLYFAEREGTAQSYRDTLSNSSKFNPKMEGGDPIPRWMFNEIKRDGAESVRRRLNKRLDHIEKIKAGGDYRYVTQNTDANALAVESDSRVDLWKVDDQERSAKNALLQLDRIENGEKIVDVGNMYEVNIDVKPDELLDWDLPLDEQPENIRKALEKTDWYQYAEEGVYEAANNRGDNPYGMDLVRYLEQDGAEDAANMMKEAGIKGIQYADAQTRFGKGPKTKNYVIFDPRLISIAKKYGIAIPAAAAMLARMTGEDTSQSYQEAS